MENPQVYQQLERLIDSKEAGKYLGFSSLTVRRMAQKKLLPSIVFPVGETGKHTYRFRASELKAHLDALEQRPELKAALSQESKANEDCPAQD
jgi:excisionase family DNA binding protein